MWVASATSRTLSPEKDLVTIVQEAAWAPELVWMFPEDLASPRFDLWVIYREKLKLCCFSTYKFIYPSVSFSFGGQNISLGTSLSNSSN
jgi:hypothetical protein